jgi:ribosome-interacting GTPase 1
MKKDLSKLSINEIEEKINELENAYAELLGNYADARQLNRIRKKISELKTELGKREKK